ncbi:hypothetical protein P7228_14960 [Altererythrobacter arenosus]|uniref:DUF3347 domain-containing protein n=1 Tax=Altererythrobacter arenosus TaxID=3032592 RepID=A0ABY8FZ39_9SPHN|nr:hypothetical protein [Altererythrobacter sp. CAU 1644]WFL77269.1 hypothetical protein P7228_14960 [Altererythrobacter sp. CAU 1644]
MKMVLTTIATSAVALSTPAMASNVEELSVPSPVDFADVRKKTDGVIEQLIAGRVGETIGEISSENPLMAEKSSDLRMVVSQFQNAVETYGKIESCSPWEQSYKSNLRIITTYVCQHRDALIFWEFQTDRLPKGWVFSNFRFNGSF